MRRVKKKIFLGAFALSVAVFGTVRRLSADSAEPMAEAEDTVQIAPVSAAPAVETKALDVVGRAVMTSSRHPIRSVHSYKDCFPDVQDVQIVSARRHGVSPVLNRAQAEERKSELVYVGTNPFYRIDSRMTSSIPYLVPRASLLLENIARNYLDSLVVKGVPMHKIIVSSVLRTEEDVARLRKSNGNASEQSCHRFGTTFDIAYNRYETVSPPGEDRRAVRNDTLKWVLSEVLRDLREAGQCHVKYEVKQGCFHITVR